MCLCIRLLHPQPHAGTFTTPGQHFPEVTSQVRYSFRWLLWRSPSQGSIQRCLYTLVPTHKHPHPRALFSSSASPRPSSTLTSVEDLTLNSTLLSPPDHCLENPLSLLKQTQVYSPTKPLPHLFPASVSTAEFLYPCVFFISPACSGELHLCQV